VDYKNRIYGKSTKTKGKALAELMPIFDMMEFLNQAFSEAKFFYRDICGKSHNNWEAQI
jgi:hypothetical protein